MDDILDELTEPIEYDVINALFTPKNKYPDEYRPYLFDNPELDLSNVSNLNAEKTNTKSKYWLMSYEEYFIKISTKIKRSEEIMTNSIGFCLAGDKEMFVDEQKYYNKIYTLVDINIAKYPDFVPRLVQDLTDAMGTSRPTPEMLIRIVFYVSCYFIKISKEEISRLVKLSKSILKKLIIFEKDPKKIYKYFTQTELANYKIYLNNFIQQPKSDI